MGKTALDLRAVTLPFASDIGNLADAVGDISTGINVLKQATTTPRIVAGTLDGIADPLTIPKTILDPLKLFPYGIGAAVKQYDRIAGLTTDQIRAQADRAWDWDEKLQAVNRIVEPLVAVVGKVSTVLNGPLDIGGLDTIVEQQAAEAQRLFEELGSTNLDGTWLGAEIEARVDLLEFSPSALIAEIDIQTASLTAAAERLAQGFPDISGLEDARDFIDSAIGPIAGAFDTLDGLLNRDYTVVPRVLVTPAINTPAVRDPIFGTVIIPAVNIPAVYTPAVVINPADIITTIGDAIGVVQDFVEQLVLDALAALGIDLFGAIDALQDTLLQPLEPIFAAIEAFDGVFDAILSGLDAAIRSVTSAWEDVLFLIENASGAASFFNLSTFGNDMASAIDGEFDEVLRGGLSEIDAVFGFAGNDDIFGGIGDILFGGEGNDRLTARDAAELFGGAGDDELIIEFGETVASLLGQQGDDTLRGDASDDLLDGGTGADRMVGGAGDDTYRVDNIGDRIVEIAGGGIDHVISTISTRLVDEVENGTLVGAARANLFGNGLANVLVGNAASNILVGGGGADSLEGGDGADFFAFRLRDGLDGVRIRDFTDADKIALDDRFFGLGDAVQDVRDVTGRQIDAALRKGFVAYDGATGEFSIDVDGRAGPAEAKLAFVIEGGGRITADDFLLF